MTFITLLASYYFEYFYFIPSISNVADLTTPLFLNPNIAVFITIFMQFKLVTMYRICKTNLLETHGSKPLFSLVGYVVWPKQTIKLSTTITWCGPKQTQFSKQVHILSRVWFLEFPWGRYSQPWLWFMSTAPNWVSLLALYSLHRQK